MAIATSVALHLFVRVGGQRLHDLVEQVADAVAMIGADRERLAQPQIPELHGVELRWQLLSALLTATKIGLSEARSMSATSCRRRSDPSRPSTTKMMASASSMRDLHLIANVDDERAESDRERHWAVGSGRFGLQAPGVDDKKAHAIPEGSP